MIKDGHRMFSWSGLLVVSFTSRALEGGYPGAGTFLTWVLSFDALVCKLFRHYHANKVHQCHTLSSVL